MRRPTLLTALVLAVVLIAAVPVVASENGDDDRDALEHP